MSLFNKEDKNHSDTQRFLEFYLGEESYAVELLSVKEVITPPEMTPIPKAPSYVVGLMNLRGLVLTVVDLRKKLGIIPVKDTTHNAVIIFDLGERMIGVMVDSIQKVLTVDAGHIKPMPDSEANSAAVVNGVLQHDNILSIWIDPGRTLDVGIAPLKKSA